MLSVQREVYKILLVLWLVGQAIVLTTVDLTMDQMDNLVMEDPTSSIVEQVLNLAADSTADQPMVSLTMDSTVN